MRMILLVTLIVVSWTAIQVTAAEPLAVGVSRRDVTPNTPVRMTGYSNRANESEGVEQRLWAKAIAIGTGEQTTVWITLDSLGIAADQSEEIAGKLKERFGLRGASERVAHESEIVQTQSDIRVVAPKETLTHR